MLDPIAEHAYDEGDIEIYRRITTTKTVREIHNHSPAERCTPRPIPFDPTSDRHADAIEPVVGQVLHTVCRSLCRR
ncbi:hypothetical protein [Rhizobium sp. J15]|uniref:hypothetical protein n=1 Tax=Rhizobium sp. J15 TaxID=2035450 RepID=UPI00114144E1|nr:hypothetical protein [Rhizobium sp. J15]